MLLVIFNGEEVLHKYAIGPMRSIDDCHLEMAAQAHARKNVDYEWMTSCAKEEQVILVGDLMYGKSAR